MPDKGTKVLISVVLQFHYIWEFYTSGTMIIGDLQKKKKGNASQCNVKTATYTVYCM